jgi:hypothetical protein
MLRSLADHWEPTERESDPGMTTADEIVAERCTEHRCCIRVPRVEASAGLPHLAGEWHLRWFPDDGAWFLVPPQGNVREVLVEKGADATDELSVDGVLFDAVRRAIHRDALFPPC